MPLLVDKPSGLTSHDVVAIVRRATGERRVGHAGTLDPLAAGLLIVLVGRAETAKQSEFLMLDKSYRMEVTLGATSTTDDAEGEITLRATPPVVDLATMQAALQQFVGEIDQRPPLHSAIHIRGQRAYQLARQQQLQPSDLPLRRVTIARITLVSWQSPLLTLEVDCSHGTYMRSLARDLGAALGVGGYTTGLRRTRIGPFHVAEAISVAQLKTGRTRRPLPK